MSFPLKSQLFNFDLFNPKVTVFPEQVFKEKFDEYLFMNLEDWFNDEDDFNRLHFFLEAINEPFLYCSVPAHYNLPDLKIDHNKGYQHFIDEYTFINRPESPMHPIGLRISPEGLWFGETADWAIVSDLINNIYIIGLKQHAALNFRADFGDKCFDVRQFISRYQPTNKARLIENYSQILR
jgi:hypothetical protein